MHYNDGRSPYINYITGKVFKSCEVGRVFITISVITGTR